MCAIMGLSEVCVCVCVCACVSECITHLDEGRNENIRVLCVYYAAPRDVRCNSPSATTLYIFYFRLVPLDAPCTHATCMHTSTIYRYTCMCISKHTSFFFIIIIIFFWVSERTRYSASRVCVSYLFCLLPFNSRLFFFLSQMTAPLHTPINPSGWCVCDFPTKQPWNYVESSFFLTFFFRSVPDENL